MNKSHCLGSGVFLLLVASFGSLGAQEERRLPELLEMSIEELLDMEVITAGKTRQRIGETPASIVILTRSDISSQGYNTLEEVLLGIPGLYGIDDYGEAGLLLGVRGFWSGVANENVVILLNSVPQTRNVFSNHPIPEIPVPVEAIDRIEVVRGPMSVVYGSGAFFGAINIITNDPSGGGGGNHVSGAMGTSETRRLFARTGRQGVESHFSANASYEHSGGVDVPARDLTSDLSALPGFGVPEDWTTGGALEEDRYFFNMSGGFQDLAFDLVAVESRKATQFQFPSYSRGHIAEYSNVNFSVNYRKAFSERFTLDSRVGFQRDGVAIQYDFLFEDFYGFQDLTSQAFTTTVDMFYIPSSKVTISSGLHYKNIMDAANSFDVPDFGAPDLKNAHFFLDQGEDIVTRAAYTQLQISPVPGVQIVAGARLEQSLAYRLRGWEGIDTESPVRSEGSYDQEELEFIPRVAGIFRLDEHHVVKALFGRAISHPSFFQNYLHVLNPGRPDLDPEDISTYELNYLGTLSDTYSVDLSYFHNVLDNLITRIIVFTPGGFYDDSWFANAGRMVTDGVEMTLAAEPGEYTRLEVSGTYQRTEDRRPEFKGVDVAYSPRFLGHLKARTRVRPDLSVALSGLYVSGMESLWDDAPSDPENGVFDPVGRIGDRVDGYLTVDGNIRWEDVIRDGFWVNLKVTNLFDAEVRYPTFTNNPWTDRGTVGHGRRVTIGFGASF